MSEAKVSTEFTCKCGKQKGWIADGEEHPNPCPNCGRRYRGQYNSKTLGIEAIEISGGKPNKSGSISLAASSDPQTPQPGHFKGYPILTWRQFRFWLWECLTFRRNLKKYPGRTSNPFGK